MFCDSMVEACYSRKKRGKPPRQYRYESYRSWSLALKKEKIGMNDEGSPHYKFPKSVLDFIRTLIPGNIKGEILDDSYDVSLDEFCEGLLKK